jgi:hypothetical protein
VTTITEAEFVRIVDGIREDRAAIIKHNPIGPDDEILLWMLLAVLSSYLNLNDDEMPCFPGKPDANTYRDAIMFVLQDRIADEFEPGQYLDRLTNAN